MIEEDNSDRYKELIHDHLLGVAHGMDERYFGLTSDEQVALADQDCLRISIWGKVEQPGIECTLYSDFLITKKTVARKWPSRGVMALVNHLIECDTCGAHYREQIDGLNFQAVMEMEV